MTTKHFIYTLILNVLSIYIAIVLFFISWITLRKYFPVNKEGGISLESITIYELSQIVKNHLKWKEMLFISMVIITLIFLPNVLKNVIEHQRTIFIKSNHEIPPVDANYDANNGGSNLIFLYSVGSLGERKTCTDKDKAYFKSNINSENFFKYAECLHNEQSYREEFKFLSSISSMQSEIDNNDYIEYIESHYLTPAIELMENRQYILWARRLLVMANNRIKGFDSQPLNSLSYESYKNINDSILFNFITSDINNFFFNFDQYWQAIRSLHSRGYDFLETDYNSLDDQLKIFYDYYSAVKLFREAKYTASYELLGTFVTSENVSPAFQDYGRILRVRTLFYCFTHRDEECGILENLNIEKTHEVIEEMNFEKINIVKESIQNDVDHYIQDLLKNKI